MTPINQAAPLISIEALLDPAFIVLSGIYDPDPNPAALETRKVMLQLHLHFQQLQTAMRESNGCNEGDILAAIREVITQATRLAVATDHHRQNR